MSGVFETLGSAVGGTTRVMAMDDVTLQVGSETYTMTVRGSPTGFYPSINILGRDFFRLNLIAFDDQPEQLYFRSLEHNPRDIQYFSSD